MANWPGPLTMADSKGKPQPEAEAAAWQHAQAHPESGVEPGKPATLDQARRFLQDPTVEKETVERKSEFLRSKGVSQADVDELLKDDAPEAQTEQPREVTSQKTDDVADLQSAFATAEIDVQGNKEDRPPIVTYPEFLLKQPPGPLLTPTTYLNMLQAAAVMGGVAVAASKWVLEPMSKDLLNARTELFATTRDQLVELTDKLENNVSVIPVSKEAAAEKNAGNGKDKIDSHEDDDQSTYDDPTELFHRDIGVQTSEPPSPGPSAAVAAAGPSTKPEPPSEQQARRVKELAASAREVKDGIEEDTSQFRDVRSSFTKFAEDMRKSALEHQVAYSGGYNFSKYGVSSSTYEPDDETKKVKEELRKMKGLLLNTRNFPPPPPQSQPQSQNLSR